MHIIEAFLVVEEDSGSASLGPSKGPLNDVMNSLKSIEVALMAIVHDHGMGVRVMQV